MKFSNLAVTLATAGSLVAAHPHKHHHRHVVKRSPVVTEVTNVEASTVVMYELNGQPISQSEVCNGIRAGRLHWVEDANNPDPCSAEDAPAATSVSQAAPVLASSSTSTFVSTSTPAPIPSPSSVADTPAKQLVQPSTPSSFSTTTTAAATSTPAVGNYDPLAGSSSPSVDSSSYDVQIASNSGVDKEFPDGEIDCSVFPSEYGAIPINWQGVGGWSGIQYMNIGDNGAINIDTAVKDQSQPFCAEKDGKTAMCSYACPPGYQKSQWPSTQGAKGESIGGLMCGSDGKLHLTNPGLSKTLCIKGTENVKVQNNLSKNAAICRTDYPGVEGETVPLNTKPGKTSPLTCPDESSYYKHENLPTSAEYYVNMQGTAVNDACTWSSDGSYAGNWAPVVFGVGTDASGLTWLSIQSTEQNFPSSYKSLDYTVELQGNFDPGVACFYTTVNGNGAYCGAGTPDNYDLKNCQSGHAATVPGTKIVDVPGCTIQLKSGQATYVLG